VCVQADTGSPSPDVVPVEQAASKHAEQPPAPPPEGTPAAAPAVAPRAADAPAAAPAVASGAADAPAVEAAAVAEAINFILQKGPETLITLNPNARITKERQDRALHNKVLRQAFGRGYDMASQQPPTVFENLTSAPVASSAAPTSETAPQSATRYMGGARLRQHVRMYLLYTAY
jgi:hypothetical protein